MGDEIVCLLQSVVGAAWREERAFGKKIFGREPEDTDALCQGISRNVFHKVFGCFPSSWMLVFEVEGKSHIVVFVSHAGQGYVVDGTIKQFRSDVRRTVFLQEDYPFGEELLSAERWHK